MNYSFATDTEKLDSLEEELNAEIANVSTFDIAGIMLGMSFDDVQTLFMRNKGLYSPRKKNSIIYTSK